MKAAILSVLFLFFVVLPAWAGDFTLDFNDTSTQFAYVQKLDTQNYGDTFARVRYLYNDDSNTNLAGIAAGVLGTPGNLAGLQLGLNVALNGGQTQDDQKFLAAGLGFQVDYAPPMLSGFGLNSHLVYSPKIFTFLDGKEYAEWGVGASYRVLPNAKVTLAFQNIQADIKNRGERDLDETVRIGILLTF